jgi:hypothetical protein
MDKTLIGGIVLAVLLLAGAFFAGRETVHCPQVDQSTIDLLSARVTEKDSIIAQTQREAARNLAIADSLATRKTPTYNEVLPRIPVGRTAAELDSIGAIIFQPW